MIFNNPDSFVKSSSSYSTFTEGALMAVYETECNYNALMKAVGISELRYYEQTGGDLFVNEAGAFGSFIDKVKKFFKAVIEKIKAIFHKFAALFNQYILSDKDFIKKYRPEIVKKSLKDFKYKGYTFPDLDKFCERISGIQSIDGFRYLNKSNLNSYKELEKNVDNDIYKPLTDDQISEAIEQNNGLIAVNSLSKKFTEDEMRDEIKEKCFGGKETFDVNINNQMSYIVNAKDDIKKAETAQKSIIKTIESYIKEVESYEKEVIKDYSSSINAKKTKLLNQENRIARAISTSLTAAYGIILDAFKQRNRQAKAICVKALSYKESAAYDSYYNSDDIFSGVTIR